MPAHTHTYGPTPDATADVFIRGNYTSDSNAMMSGFLNEFADAEDAVGSAATAQVLRGEARAMKAAMNALLWDGSDHFVTQVNPDDLACAAKGTCRDYVDYDSNLIAVAHGVPNTTQRATAVLDRVDKGRCSAAQGSGPQFVSEIYYGKDATTGGNTGDSWCSMGRIAWFDAHARKLVGRPSDIAAFDADLKLLQDDLIKNTWLNERYGCDGKQQPNRTTNYFEYPSTVAMLLREVRYGIRLGWNNVVVDPMGPSSFNYHVGNVNVDYAPISLAFDVPGAAGATKYEVHGVRPSTMFTVVLGAGCAASGAASSVASDATGLLTFIAPAAVGCRVTATGASS